MKKVIGSIMPLLILINLFSLVVIAQEETIITDTIEGVEYQYCIKNGEALLKKCIKISDKKFIITLPKMINGYPLTGIEKNAFYDELLSNHLYLDLLVLPDTIKKLDDFALYSVNAKILVIPDSVTDIGNYNLALDANLGKGGEALVGTPPYRLPATLVMCSKNSSFYNKYSAINRISKEYKEGFNGEENIEFAFLDDLIVYNDLAEDSWYKYFVYSVIYNRIMIGTSQTKFEPTKNITRAEFITALYNKYCVNKESFLNVQSFDDVPCNSWYAPACAWAKQEQISVGTGNGLFEPNKVLTREESVTLLNNIIYPNVQYSSSTFYTFKDHSLVSSWANIAFCNLTYYNIVNGDGNGYLNPKDCITRAEIAKLLI